MVFLTIKTYYFTYRRVTKVQFPYAFYLHAGPANFLAAPATDFFQAAPAPDYVQLFLGVDDNDVEYDVLPEPRCRQCSI